MEEATAPQTTPEETRSTFGQRLRVLLIETGYDPDTAHEAVVAEARAFLYREERGVFSWLDL